MQVAPAQSEIKQARSGAVAQALAEIRTIERSRGVNRDALAEIRDRLIGLAARKELFPVEDFDPAKNPGGRFPIYRLSEDTDHRFALYMSVSIGAKDVAPHNHTTWAVIAGVRGSEENRFYERSDDGSRQGRGELKRTGGETVRPGTGVAMMAEDIHSIHPRNETPSLHLHLYGLALEQLTGREIYDLAKGTRNIYPVMTQIVEAR